MTLTGECLSRVPALLWSFPPLSSCQNQAHFSLYYKCIFSVSYLFFFNLQVSSSLQFWLAQWSTQALPALITSCHTLPILSDFLVQISQKETLTVQLAFLIFLCQVTLKAVGRPIHGSWSSDLYVCMGRGKEAKSCDTTQPPGSGGCMRQFPTEGFAT